MFHKYNYRKLLKELIKESDASRINRHAEENWTRQIGSNPITEARIALTWLEIFLYARMLAIFFVLYGLWEMFQSAPVYVDQWPVKTVAGLLIIFIGIALLLMELVIDLRYRHRAKHVKNAIDFWKHYCVAEIQYGDGIEMFSVLHSKRLRYFGEMLIAETAQEKIVTSGADVPDNCPPPILTLDKRYKKLASLLFGHQTISEEERSQMEMVIYQAAWYICGVDRDKFLPPLFPNKIVSFDPAMAATS